MPYLQPLNLIRKKMNSWHLTSRLTARSFSESTASRVRSGRCPRQCATLFHGQMYLQEKTPVLQFGHTLEQNSSICTIISYLWMVDLVMRFFSCGASLWRSSTRIRPKKGPAPWILFLTPAPRPLQVTFFWLVKLNICVCTLLQGQMHFQQKNACFAIWARVDTKFLNSSHHVLSVDDWPGDATFFLWGQPLKIIRKYSVKKRSSPLDFIFDTCASASSSHFFGWWSWTCVSVPFCKDKCIFRKKMPVLQFGRVDTKFLNSSHHVLSVDDWPGDAFFFLWANLWRLSATCVLQFGRALTQNSWIRPIMSYQWMIGLVMRLFSCGANLWRSSASIQSKKVQPLGFYFWPLRLGLLKSLFWLVKVNICVCTLLQSHVKNHTPSINHGSFFSWGLTFRYVLVNSHLIHPPSNSWLLTLGILQTYPLSESFMIDFLMPYIHRLIDQPPLNHNRQKLISCHCTSGTFQEKKYGPFLVWYFIPGPISCPGTLTHCLLDFWKIVFFKKRTEPPGKKTGSTEEGTSKSQFYLSVVAAHSKSQFHLTFRRSNLVSCERVVAAHSKSQFYLTFRRSNLVSCERVVAAHSKAQFHFSFWRSKLVSFENVVADTSKSQFYKILPHFSTIELHFVRKGCELLRPTLQKRNFTWPQFLATEARFVRKGFRGTLKIAISPHFLVIEARFVRKGCRRGCKLAISLQFLPIEPRFVRKGCVSCRLVGTAPRLKREIEKKEKEEGKRARGQESKRARENVKMWRREDVMWRWEDVKMWGCEDVKMWGCEDVRMWRCEDEKMWRWEDVKMWGCEDENMWRWEDVKMRICEDEKMWRWEDVKMRRCEDENMWRWEDVKMRRCEDEKMWRWEDVKMRRCEDVRMWRCEDVRMRRCEDVRMWRCEDVRMRRCEDLKMWCENVKMWKCLTDPHY